MINSMVLGGLGRLVISLLSADPLLLADPGGALSFASSLTLHVRSMSGSFAAAGQQVPSLFPTTAAQQRNTT